MCPNNSAAVTYIKKLKGVMIVLNEDSMGDVDYFNVNYCPKFDELENFSDWM